MLYLLYNKEWYLEIIEYTRNRMDYTKQKLANLVSM